MATERQIQANRANAAKSTGPVTPEGKSIASRNAARHHLLSSTIVLKGESVRAFNELFAALNLQFHPSNPAESKLVHAMAVAHWRQLRMWGIQTAGFQMEMSRQDPSAGSAAVLAALAFRHLADNSRVLDLLHRYESAFERSYQRALSLLLKLRATPDSSARPHLPFQLVTETWSDDFPNQANFGGDSGALARSDDSAT